MKNNRIIYIVYLLLLCSSCKFSSSSYEYYENFQLYVKDVFKISELSSQETGFFYVILVDGCKPCVESSVELLLKTKCKNLTVIAVGDICSSEWVDDFKKIKKEYLLLEDFNKQIFKYEVGFGKPLLLKVVDNRCVDFLYVTDFDYEKAELILNETCILN